MTLSNFRATYKDGKQVYSEFTGYDLESAVRQAKKTAKEHGWVLVSIHAEQYLLTPRIEYPQDQRRDRHPGLRPVKDIMTYAFQAENGGL